MARTLPPRQSCLPLWESRRVNSRVRAPDYLAHTIARNIPCPHTRASSSHSFQTIGLHADKTSRTVAERLPREYNNTTH